MSEEDRIKQLEQWYKEELEKRDKEIERLNEDNIVLLKSSLKQAKKLKEWQEITKKLQK